MVAKVMKEFFMMMALTMVSACIYSQNNVPFGIHYQAVARNSSGTELTNTKISVRFSVISGDPLGTLVYQELHQDVITSKFGVFSLVIGHGVPSSSSPVSSISEVSWKDANHYLKVEVKFENEFMDMGTMQFLTVPYAFYAQKSLEPGPAGAKGDKGEKGDPGDPASDKQTLSFDGSNLTISGSNSTVPLTGLLQDLSVTADGTGGYNLSISRGSSINLATVEKDGDPTNEIQDLVINNDVLKITKNPNATSWDLSKYLDDKQQLSFNETDNKLSLTNSVTADLSKLFQSLNFNPVTGDLTISGNPTPVNLSSLKNDADADPTNELQTLNFDKTTGDLTISSKNTVNLNNSIGFKARKSIPQTGLTIATTYPFINTEAEFIDGGCYDGSSGNFTAPTSGIYSFYVTYKADGSGSARVLTMLKNELVYEVLGPDISAGSELFKWVTIKLAQGDVVRLTINTGMSTVSGTGMFVGYRVN